MKFKHLYEEKTWLTSFFSVTSVSNTRLFLSLLTLLCTPPPVTLFTDYLTSAE